MDNFVVFDIKDYHKSCKKFLAFVEKYTSTFTEEEQEMLRVFTGQTFSITRFAIEIAHILSEDEEDGNDEPKYKH